MTKRLCIVVLSLLLTPSVSFAELLKDRDWPQLFEVFHDSLPKYLFGVEPVPKPENFLPYRLEKLPWWDKQEILRNLELSVFGVCEQTWRQKWRDITRDAFDKKGKKKYDDSFDVRVGEIGRALSAYSMMMLLYTAENHYGRAVLGTAWAGEKIMQFMYKELASICVGSSESESVKTMDEEDKRVGKNVAPTERSRPRQAAKDTDGLPPGFKQEAIEKCKRQRRELDSAMSMFGGGGAVDGMLGGYSWLNMCVKSEIRAYKQLYGD